MKIRICPSGKNTARENLKQTICGGSLPVWLAFALFDQGLFYTARNQARRQHAKQSNKTPAQPSETLRCFVDRTGILDDVDVDKLAVLVEDLCRDPDFKEHLPSVLNLTKIHRYLKSRGWRFISLDGEQLARFKAMAFGEEAIGQAATTAPVVEPRAKAGANPVEALRSRMQHLKQEYNKAASALQLVIAQERDRLKKDYERRLAELDQPVEDWDEGTSTTSEAVDRLQKIISL